MKRCSLFCTGTWPFIFLPLLLLLPLLFFKWQSIEEDVAKNARSELSAAGAAWVNVETINRGRDILITGTPPNETAIEAAQQTASASYGVNKVDVSSDVTPAVAAQLRTIITSKLVVLRGTLADQQSINMLVSQAEKAFGTGNVTNKLEVKKDTLSLPNLDGFFLSLTNKSFSLETMTASLVGNQLSLKGTVINDLANQMLETQMTVRLGLDVTNLLSVMLPPVERDVCEDLVNDLLSSSTLNFPSGLATIHQDSFALLENIKYTALRCPAASFEVLGYTDSEGTASFNMVLSEQRAQAVVDHLVGLGLNADKFIARGFGLNTPVGDNDTDEGRAQNRRIEFKLKN